MSDEVNVIPELPEEIWDSIFRLLPQRDLSRFSGVSRQWAKALFEISSKSFIGALPYKVVGGEPKLHLSWMVFMGRRKSTLQLLAVSQVPHNFDLIIELFNTIGSCYALEVLDCQVEVDRNFVREGWDNLPIPTSVKVIRSNSGELTSLVDWERLANLEYLEIAASYPGIFHEDFILDAELGRLKTLVIHNLKQDDLYGLDPDLFPELECIRLIATGALTDGFRDGLVFADFVMGLVSLEELELQGIQDLGTELGIHIGWFRGHQRLQKVSISCIKCSHTTLYSLLEWPQLHSLTVGYLEAASGHGSTWNFSVNMGRTALTKLRIRSSFKFQLNLRELLNRAENLESLELSCKSLVLMDTEHDELKEALQHRFILFIEEEKPRPEVRAFLRGLGFSSHRFGGGRWIAANKDMMLADPLLEETEDSVQKRMSLVLQSLALLNATEYAHYVFDSPVVMYRNA